MTALTFFRILLVLVTTTFLVNVFFFASFLAKILTPLMEANPDVRSCIHHGTVILFTYTIGRILADIVKERRLRDEKSKWRSPS